MQNKISPVFIFFKKLIQSKITISIMIILVLIIGGYFLFHHTTTYQFVPVKSGSIDEIVSITGNTTPTQSVSLSFGSGGIVSSIYSSLGKKVSAGQILAELNVDDLAAQLHIAQASYNKILNGATGPSIDVAKAAVNIAQVNLDGVTKQQAVLVEDAHKNLLNSTPEVLPYNNSNDYVAPIISGNYNKDVEGQIILSIYASGSASGYSFSTKGIISTNGPITLSVAEPIGDTGLYIKFPSGNVINVTDWVINIPNTKAANYVTNYNAYETALENQSQATQNAQATLDQANASLTALVATARPEDVATARAGVDSALGALQIAQAAYNNTIITAPMDGTITNITITAGQIATPNTPAIELLSQ